MCLAIEVSIAEGSPRSAATTALYSMSWAASSFIAISANFHWMP